MYIINNNVINVQINSIMAETIKNQFSKTKFL